MNLFHLALITASLISPVAVSALEIEFDHCAGFRTGYNAQGEWRDNSRAYRECRKVYAAKPTKTYRCNNLASRRIYELEVKNEDGAFLVRESANGTWQESPFLVREASGRPNMLNLELFDRKGRLKTHSNCELAN